MPGKPSNLIQFWQELKRRKVVRVIAMYAGAAYIIIELVSNITEPLHLPGWTTTLVILLLAIGFPITAILSWIFDVTPEGLKKTEPIKLVKEKESATKLVKRKLRASDVIIAVLVVTVVSPGFVPRLKNTYFLNAGSIIGFGSTLQPSPFQTNIINKSGGRDVLDIIRSR